MKRLIQIILEYKSYHPIAFWGVLSGVLIMSAMFIVLYYFTKLNNSRDYEEERLKENESFSKLKHLSLVVLGIAIGVVSTLLFNIKLSSSENPFISNSKHVFGIDVSHYQGRVNWLEMRTSHHPIEYVFIRSTMGVDGEDKYFDENWLESKENGYIRGAYHYYRPNENSEKQFNNFKNNVVLKKGDFPPILDVERASKYGAENLREGVSNWLKLAEKHYGVKPVVYTGRTFYHKYLKGHVDEYPLWIASYSGKSKLKGITWKFHQFTEKVRVKGIRTTVDGNDFNGELSDLKEMCLK